MYIQWCVKGISGAAPPKGITFSDAIVMIRSGSGIISNWWRKEGTISPGQVAGVLTAGNLDRHLHDYASYGPETPFISLASDVLLFIQRAQRIRFSPCLIATMDFDRNDNRPNLMGCGR
jgi:hypothetical protein